MDEARILRALEDFKKNELTGDQYKLINYLRSNVDDIIEAMGA